VRRNSVGECAAWLFDFHLRTRPARSASLAASGSKIETRHFAVFNCARRRGHSSWYFHFEAGAPMCTGQWSLPSWYRRDAICTSPAKSWTSGGRRAVGLQPRAGQPGADLSKILIETPVAGLHQDGERPYPVQASSFLGRSGRQRRRSPGADRLTRRAANRQGFWHMINNLDFYQHSRYPTRVRCR